MGEVGSHGKSNWTLANFDADAISNLSGQSAAIFAAQNRL